MRDFEEYWYMEGSPDPRKSVDGSQPSRTLSCQLIGQCSASNLACARVCPSPVTDSFVTVGFDGSDSQKGWYAQLWKLQQPSLGEQEVLKCVVSFRGGSEYDKLVGSTGSHQPSLCAAELAIRTQSINKTEGVSGGKRAELLLCSLSVTGFVTTHVSKDQHFTCMTTILSRLTLIHLERPFLRR
jgi:hypothetical protein